MKKQFQLLFAAAAMIMVLAPAANAQNWTNDGVHSTLMYSIRHFVTPVVGVFKKFTVNMTFDPANPAATTIDATVDPSSVQMGMSKLEDHLKSQDFFDVAKFPEWTFKSTAVKAVGKKSPNKYVATGNLTIHGVTKTVTLPFEFLGVKESPYGKKGGFSVEFAINRVDYGVGQDDDSVVGKEVKITAFLEMNPVK
jgi:polyisoprenoid-binding protein YceI